MSVRAGSFQLRRDRRQRGQVADPVVVGWLQQQRQQNDVARLENSGCKVPQPSPPTASPMVEPVGLRQALGKYLLQPMSPFAEFRK